MARTAIDAGSIVDISGPQILTVAADAADVIFDPSDSANGNEVQLNGGEYLLVRNADVGAQTVTITAAPDSIGRAGSIAAYSLAADEVAIFGPFPQAGWKQSDGMFYVDTSSDNVELAVLRP